MPYTLVIVDMQASFSAANNKRVRDNCKHEIIKATDKGGAIIFVEFIGCGRTIPGLVKLTDDYNRAFIVRKDDEDGSREVHKVIKDNKLPSRRIKVCGVNTDQCVLATVCGLNSLMKQTNIEVITKACNSYSNHDHESGLKYMEKLPKVILNKKVN